MDLEIVILNEVRQRQKYTILICRIQQNGTNELIYKIKADTDIENKFVVTKGERWGDGTN